MIKTGDRVRLVKEPRIGWVEDMFKNLGREVEVDKVMNVPGEGYLLSIKEDPHYFVYDNNDIEEVFTKPTNKYDIKVRHNNNVLSFQDVSYEQLKVLIDLTAGKEGALLDIRIKRGE